MKKYPWIFLAIALLLFTNLLLGQYKLIGLVLFSLWLMRIILLKNQMIFIQSICLIVLFTVIIFQQTIQNKTDLEGDEELFLISLNKNSLKVDGDRLSFSGKLEKVGNKKTNEKLIVHYYIQSEKEKDKWKNTFPPDQLILKGELIKALANTNFNQFDYQKYLKRKRIHWQLEVQEIRQINSQQKNTDIVQKIDELRYKIIRYMDNTFHKKIASYLKILFMAEKSALSEQSKKSYRAMGIIHFFSISGFHISYLARMIQRSLLRIGISHETTNIILLITLPIYGLIAGLSISIFRAISQKVLKILSVMFNRTINSLDAWAMTMILSLLIDPYAIFDLAFQLSYSLSAMFILMGRRKWINELSILRQGLLYSILSMLVSLPFLSYHFYEISWMTILSNIIFAPFFSCVLFPGLLLLFFMSFLLSKIFLFYYLNNILALILIKMESIFLTMTEHINLTFVIGRLPHYLLLFLVAIILYLLIKIENKKRPSSLILMIMFLCIMWNKLSPIGYVLFLDVGQGDSILIKDPSTRKISLIDTGGRVSWQEKENWQKRNKNFTIGKDVVVPSIKSLGISTIDRLYISHAHADHMGEIKNIYEEIKIKEVASTLITLEDESVKKQLSGLKEKRIVEVKENSRLDYPTPNTLAVHPGIHYNDKNNQSLVLYVKIGKDYWLFTGDLEAQGEKDLIETYPSLSANYLKVAHHGSSTSSTEEFINTIQPRNAFVSVAKKNRHNHPNPELIESFLERKMNTYLTSEDGAIKISYFKVPLVNKWSTKIERVNKD